MKTSDTRVQVDRWPIDPEPDATGHQDYVLTVITVCTFDQKPNKLQIKRVLTQAAQIVMETGE